MHRWFAMLGMSIACVLQAGPQAEPVVLKTASRAVQMDVFVSDASGKPVHGLQKNDFVVTDNGRRREIRIFGGEIDAARKPASGTEPAPGVYSNRIGLRDSRIATAIVIDAIPRPVDAPRNAGRPPAFWADGSFGRTMRAINRMRPGQVMAIYAICPELRVVQAFTSDAERLAASLRAFVPPRLPDAAGKKPTWTIDGVMPPMLSALRDVAGRMSGASGSKSVVWFSNLYGTGIDIRAVSDVANATVATLNDANVSLYAVDTSWASHCGHVDEDPNNRPVPVNCFQSADASDEWMDDLARATGGRAFTYSGFSTSGDRTRIESGGGTTYEFHLQDQGDHSLVGDAMRFAADDSRYAYQMGFYVPEAELDGLVHRLEVSVPAKPKFELRYRAGYTASAAATAPLDVQEPSQETAKTFAADEVGIEAKIEIPAKAKNEVRVSLAVAPETVARTVMGTVDGAVALDVSFTQVDDFGKQVSSVQETVGTVRFDRAVKLSNAAVLLRVRIRDQATGHTGSITIPIAR